VARDRQRAKQRKARRAAQNPGPAPSEPHRDNVPGPLEHASGEVDEFDAALVSGAEGRTSDDEPAGDPARGVDEPLADEAPVDEPFAADEPARRERFEEPDETDFEDEDEDDFDDDQAARAERTPATRPQAAPARTGGPARFLAFLRASWAELQRVQWPDRRQVAQATAVVLGFVVVAGVYLGVADKLAQEVVDLII
jgi:preprotein translocase SecE subunit